MIVNRITLLGQKDHGKSTVIGNLLISTGSVTAERVKEARKISEQIGKPFEPAFIMDSFSEEREQGLTIDTTRADIAYNGRIFEFIDVPGHLELMKNMMSGASSGDVAVVVISAKRGEGFTAQTRRHIFIASMFGMRALIVAVNKLDYMGYDERKFQNICEMVRDYLGRIGFDKPVEFVPISAYSSENLIKKSKKMPWYDGLPLMDTIGSFISKYGEAPKGKSVRILVQSIADGASDKVAFGMVYSGSIKVGEKLRVQPAGMTTAIKKIYLKGLSAKSAPAGTNVALELADISKVSRGSVLYGAADKPYSMNRFEAKVFAIKRLERETNGRIHMKINNNDVPIRALNVLRAISPVTGSEEKSASISPSNSGIIALQLKSRYPVENFEECAELGRFALYEGNEFLGIGTVR